MSSYIPDQTDKMILALLQKDATLTSKEIAVHLNRSTSTVNERISRLKKEKIITRYTIVLNKQKLPKHCIFFTHIQLTLLTQQSTEDFIRSVLPLTEVIDCHKVTGNADFILKIRAKDMPTYHELLLQKINKISRVGIVRTFATLSQEKGETNFPVSLLMAVFISNAVGSFMM